MKRKIMTFTALLVCLLVLSGSAPAYTRHVTVSWAAETPLYAEPVCPTLLPGSEDGSVVVRWVSWNDRPVLLHYGPDDGSGVLGEDHEIITVESARSIWPGQSIYTAELSLGPGNWLYSLTETGQTEPGVLYPVRRPHSGCFRLVMSSDSHIVNYHHSEAYEAAIARALREGGADMIFHGGDMNDNLDTATYELSSCAPHTRSIPTLTVAGNHDLGNLIYQYYTPPHLDGVTGDYWTVQGGVLFVGVNANNRDWYAHRRYLLETVPAHRQGCDWVVLVTHFSMMSNGAHAMDGPVLNLCYALREAISELDIDLVLSGHDHEYDRSFLITGTDMVEGSGGQRVEKRPGETVYISLPTATGVKMYKRSRTPIYQPAVEGPQSERGYVTAEFTPESVEITARNLDSGTQADHFILTRAESDGE